MTTPFRLNSKLPGVGTTIFTVMSKLAADLGAINLSQGFPDFDCDPALIDAVARHMREGRNQYAPMQGVPALREAIAAKYELFHGRRYDPDTEVTVTSGGTEAIFDAVAASRPGRRSHRPGALLRLLRPGDRAERRDAGGGAADAARLPARLGGAARGGHAADTCHHHQHAAQPDRRDSDSAATSSELKALVRGTDILIISDEVYEHIIFDGAQHESMARHPELAERSFIIGSFGKTYHVTGWKVGYAVAPAALTAEFRKVHQFVTFSTNTPVQHALAEMMANAAEAARARAVLPGQARPVPQADGGIAIPAAALPRQLLPADGLLGDHGRGRLRTSRSG